MHTNGKETVTDKSGDTKGTDCTINCVYHVSLPYKTELAEVKKKKKKGLASIFSYGFGLNRRDYFKIKTIWVLFFINKN